MIPVETLPEKAIAQQRAAYTALLQSLGQASFEEIQQVMDERETIEPEKGLSPEIVKKLQDRIHAQQLST